MSDYHDIALAVADRAERVMGDALADSIAGLSFSDNAVQRAAAACEHMVEINLARAARGTLTWDGLVLEAAQRAASETDPDFRYEAVEELAALAVAHLLALSTTSLVVTDEADDKDSDDGEDD